MEFVDNTSTALAILLNLLVFVGVVAAIAGVG
jgi:hypothetical protein